MKQESNIMESVSTVAIVLTIIWGLVMIANVLIHQ